MRARCVALSWFTCASTQRRFLTVLLVDRLNLIEKAIDRVGEVGARVEQTVLGDLGRDLAPERELFRLRIRLTNEHRVMERSVYALAVEDLVDPVVALEQLDLRDAWKRTLDLALGCRRRRRRCRTS